MSPSEVIGIFLAFTLALSVYLYNRQRKKKEEAKDFINSLQVPVNPEDNPVVRDRRNEMFAKAILAQMSQERSFKDESHEAA